MKTLFLVLILFVGSATCLFSQTVDDLIFLTEEYPPYNFTADGKVQGISTDALLAMLKVVGASQSREDIGSFPWARGYEVALHTRDVLLFSTTRTAAREKQFRWVGPIISSKIVLFARKDRNISLHSLADIDRQRLHVGAVLNDVGEQFLLESGVPRSRIYRFNKGLNLAEMLQKGRIDLMAYGKLVSLWNLKSLGYDPHAFEAVYTLKQVAYYYALNKKTDDQVVQRLQQALDQVKKSGTLAKIIQRYIN